MKIIVIGLCACICGVLAQSRSQTDEKITEIFGTPQNVRQRSTRPPNTTDPTDADYWDVGDDFVPFEGQRNEDFDWGLVKALSSRGSGNLLVSPISVKLLLTMLYEGARGDTQKELKTVLNLPEGYQPTRERVKSVLDSLKVPNKDYTLEFGSRLYLSEQVKSRQRYGAIMKMFYQTDLVGIDFSTPIPAKDKINAWVSSVTHGKIKDLVSPSDIEGSVLILLNAIYFKGAWRSQFPANQTAPGQFHVTPTKQISVDYMSQTGRYFYLESKDLDSKILRIPYKGRKFSMFFVLPNTRGGLHQLLEDIDSVTLRRHLWLMDEVEVKVTLPKFKFDSTSHMSEVLKDMGIKEIFADTASLPGIARGLTADNRLVVTNVLQKAGLEVNEQGSSLYAATEIVLTNKFGNDNDLEFHASRPFLFFVEDETTGAVLFIGKVEDPSTEMTEDVTAKPTNVKGRNVRQ